MAVLNLNGIQQRGIMIAEKKRNEKKNREEYISKMVRIIQENHLNAIDAVDTIEEMWRNGFTCKFASEKVLEIVFNSQSKSFCIKRSIPSGRSSDKIEVGYIPRSNKVFFYTYYGWGGHEYYEYDTSSPIHDYHVEQIYGNKDYKELLILLANSLAPYLKAFFSFVESL